MTIPSLLTDYKKYENMEKDPTSDYVDLSNIPFVAPASFLPTYHFARSNSITKYKCHDNNIEHISKILGISEGNNNLIPMIPINIGKYEEAIKYKILNHLESKIRKLLFQNDIKGHEEYGGVDTFPYIVGEILSNVGQHSEATNVYSYSQIYPNEGYVDVGIFDDGITIPGKYEQSKHEFEDNKINPYEFKNDCDAIYRSLNGISTKEGFKRSMGGLLSEDDVLTKNDNIGYGINTSTRMIYDGLGGSFLIVSRGGICHLTPDKKKFIKAKDDNIIDGTLICIRFKRAKLTHDEFDEYTRNHIPIVL